MLKIELIQNDITKMDVDAVVNAANNSLLGGGGVDGAIHRAAGSFLLKACKPLNGCETGDAKVTPGFKLNVQYIIHTVGPVWNGGKYEEENLLISCYKRSLEIAIDLQVTTIAFPNISTGVYEFPKDKAALIAINTVREFLNENKNSIETVYFNCWDDENYEIYNSLLEV